MDADGQHPTKLLPEMLQQWRQGADVVYAVRQTRADPKDPVADALIREAVALQADAPYLLVQRAMGLGLALDAAQARIQQLEAQCAEQAARLLSAPTAAPATPSFLMSGAQAWGRGTEAVAVPVSVPVASAAPVQSRAAVSGAAPQASAWGGGLMAQVATTAAGAGAAAAGRPDLLAASAENSSRIRASLGLTELALFASSCSALL